MERKHPLVNLNTDLNVRKPEIHQGDSVSAIASTSSTTNIDTNTSHVRVDGGAGSKSIPSTQTATNLVKQICHPAPPARCPLQQTNVDSFLRKKIGSRLLDYSAFSASHTSSNLATEIRRIIEEWHLDKKVIMVISDNASNIKKAVKDELKLKHLGCYAHTINLIGQDALKKVSGVLEKIKSVVGFFRRSSSGMAKLLEQQKQFTQQLKLIQDVQTRWNSTYCMLERFVQLEVPIRTTIAVLDKDLPLISVVEWGFLKQL
ncbi:hypothetical protein NQ315_003218 [Exocentrus adspersus]|uniref:Zinc finger BED domain-containing protein 4 n=1 Tax=Exocentrus adspersus TaxID=1586481 RepID=A0AAV8VNU3_9CUCU|nr:hypothetical protein NQ315_003218 [Exocentrus adspersus]